MRSRTPIHALASGAYLAPLAATALMTVVLLIPNRSAIRVFGTRSADNPPDQRPILQSDHTPIVSRVFTFRAPFLSTLQAPPTKRSKISRAHPKRTHAYLNSVHWHLLVTECEPPVDRVAP